MQLLTVEDVARTLKISKWEVYRMAAEGRIDRVKIGRSVRIPQEALEHFVAANTQGAF